MESYQTHLDRWTAYLERQQIPILSVDLERIEAWLVKLKGEERATATTVKVVYIIKGFYKWLRRRGMIQENPFDRLEPIKREKKIPEFLGEEEVAHLIRLAAKGVTGNRCHLKRNRAILEVLYATGCRASELCSMDLEHVSFDGSFVKIYKGKGRKERLAPLGKTALKAIRAYLPARQKQLERNATPFERALFVSQRGRMTRSGIKDFFRTLREKGGYGKRLYAHLLRHSFATHLHNRGVDIRDLQEMMGHDRVSSTEIYTHVATERLSKVYKKAHPRA